MGVVSASRVGERGAWPLASSRSEGFGEAGWDLVCFSSLLLRRRSFCEKRGGLNYSEGPQSVFLQFNCRDYFHDIHLHSFLSMNSDVCNLVQISMGTIFAFPCELLLRK